MSIKHNKMFIVMLLIITSVYYGCSKSADVPVNTPVTQMDNTNSGAKPDTMDNKIIETEFVNSTHSDESMSTTEISKPDDSENSVLNDLFNAVSNNDIKKVKELIRIKVDVNAKDHKGHSVLFYANTVEMADYLIKHGAVIDNSDEFLDQYYKEMIEDKHCNGIQLVDVHNFEEDETYQQKKNLKDKILIEKSNLFIYYIDHGAKLVHHGNYKCLKGNDERIQDLRHCGMTSCPRY